MSDTVSSKEGIAPWPLHLKTPLLLSRSEWNSAENGEAHPTKFNTMDQTIRENTPE